MINNCQKCGNPLQEGVTSCPICGTNINEAQAALTEQVAVQPTATVAQVTEAAPQPVQTTQSVTQPTVVAAPVVETVQPVVEAQPTQQPVQQQVVTQQVEAAPQPVQQIAAQPVAVQPQVVAQPAPQPQVVQPVVTQPSAPVVEPTAAPQLAQSTPTVAPAAIAQSLEALASQNPTQPVVDVPAQSEVQPKTKKIDIKNLTKNQKIIAIAVVAVVIMTIVGISLSSSSLGKPTVPAQNQNPTTPQVETKEIASNGYKLKLEKDWIIEEGSGNIVIKKEDDSVVINVKNSPVTIEQITKESLNSYFSTQPNFTDIKVEETELSGKKTYIVDVTYSLNGTDVKYPVQYYYINGGTNLIIGAAIVYQDDDAKTDNAAFITNLMGTMSYSDDTIKALDTINMYSEVFQKYVFSLRPPVEPTIENNMNETVENQS